MEILYSDPYWTVTVDEPRALVRVKRSAAPFPALDAAEAGFDGMLAVVKSRDLTKYRLLVDSRDAVGRNDPEFEQRVGRFRELLMARFSRSVMLVRTVVGKMQVDRLNRENVGPGFEVYTDETAAMLALSSHGSTP